MTSWPQLERARLLPTAYRVDAKRQTAVPSASRLSTPNTNDRIKDYVIDVVVRPC